VLYFIISELLIIDPMYQYSLTTFIRHFNDIIHSSAKSTDVDERLEILKHQTTFQIFRNVCRGLFNEHKLLFSFFLAIKIELSQETIT
jgi:dynein heavy chain